MKTRIADFGAATSAALAGTAWLANLDLIVSITAGLVAIIAGVAAAVYHITRTRRMKKGAAQKTD